MKFTEFNLSNPLLDALQKMGFDQATTVQKEVYPLAVQGQDVMVSSQTGSGKTVGFLLPIYQQILTNNQVNHPPKRAKGRNRRGRSDVAKPRALIICPTRELAAQVAREAISLKGEIRGFRVATVVGGMPYGRQLRELENVTILVATPGRLLDLYNRGAVSFDEVKYFVADEADRMLDMGFSEDLKRLHKNATSLEQTLMFSATFPRNVMGLAESMMEDPARVELSIEESINEKIVQHLNWSDGREHQKKLLLHWLESAELDQAVVFTSTQRESEEIATELKELGASANFLHGGLQQNVRNRRLDDLRRGRTQILVATDVAARGIDVASISHVINYGLPRKPEDYVHRIGRTGRAGRSGTAITLLHHKDGALLDAVTRYIKMPLEATTIEGLEPRKKVERSGRGKKRARNNRRNNSGGPGSRRARSTRRGNESNSNRNNGARRSAPSKQSSGRNRRRQQAHA